MLAEEGEHLAPAIHCLLGPVEWPVPIEDTVASTIVAVELVHLAVLLELALVLVHLFRARRAVVVAEFSALSCSGSSGAGRTALETIRITMSAPGRGS